MPGNAAENHLAQPALRVGALDNHVEPQRIRPLDNGLSNRLAARLDMLAGRIELDPRTLGEPPHAECRKHLVGAAQLLARIEPTTRGMMTDWAPLL